MVRRHKAIDGPLQELLNEGKWTEFVKTIRFGIYSVVMPDYSSLRSFQVVVSRMNNDDKHPYRLSMSVNYEQPITVRLTVLKKRCKKSPTL